MYFLIVRSKYGFRVLGVDFFGPCFQSREGIPAARDKADRLLHLRDAVGVCRPALISQQNRGNKDVQTDEVTGISSLSNFLILD